MTTEGGFIKPSGELRGLVDAIQRDVQTLEAAGMPVVVELVPPVALHTQRLYAAFGVLVRFIPEQRQEIR